MNTKRPIGVWVISLFNFISVGIAFAAIMLLVMVPGDGVEADFMDDTAFNVVTVVLALILVVASVLLLRLRKTAFHWFLAHVAASVLLSIWDVISKGYADSVLAPEVAGYTVFGLVVGLVICVYCWRLIRKGILQ